MAAGDFGAALNLVEKLKPGESLPFTGLKQKDVEQLRDALKHRFGDGYSVRVVSEDIMTGYVHAEVVRDRA